MYYWYQWCVWMRKLCRRFWVRCQCWPIWIHVFMVLTVVAVAGCGANSSVDRGMEVCWFWLVDVDCCPFSVYLLINSSHFQCARKHLVNIQDPQHTVSTLYQSVRRVSQWYIFSFKGAQVLLMCSNSNNILSSATRVSSEVEQIHGEDTDNRSDSFLNALSGHTRSCRTEGGGSWREHSETFVAIFGYKRRPLLLHLHCSTAKTDGCAVFEHPVCCHQPLGGGRAAGGAQTTAGTAGEAPGPAGAGGVPCHGGQSPAQREQQHEFSHCPALCPAPTWSHNQERPGFGAAEGGEPPAKCYNTGEQRTAVLADVWFMSQQSYILSLSNCVGTSQALQVSSNYRELEKKYGALTSMMSSQNQFIARLEKQCQCRDSTQPSLVWKTVVYMFANLYCVFTQALRMVCCFFLCCSEQVTTEAPKSQSNVHPNYSSGANEMTNDVQRDQSASPPQQEKTVHSLPTTTVNIPTDPPFISLPVTKTPGTSV